jgi:hypothetical protein
MKARLLLLFSLICLLVSCNPDEASIEVRADDITDAIADQKVMVPVVYKFSMLGDDKDEKLQKCAEIVRKYLPEESKFSISNGNFGKQLTITSMIPLVQFVDGKVKMDFLKSPVLLVITHESQFPAYKRTLQLINVEPVIEKLNQELAAVSLGLSFSPLAKTTNIELEGSGDSTLDFLAVAALVDGKAGLLNTGSLKKRQKMTVTFKASIYEGSSIWDQIPISVFLK